jgi:cation diffusion facilitator CzcD-associated flavoprotein CzcO
VEITDPCEETSVPEPDHDVVIIGAGFSGIGAAIALRDADIEDFVVLDERDDVGGVWLVNTYPGVAVDITSFTYSFAFEPNPSWSRVFAPGQELKAYADHCVAKYGLRRHLRLNTRVTSAEYDEELHLWRLALAGGTEVTARFVISAVGGLTKPKTPDIDGLADFNGRTVHTAAWDHALDLAGKRVAVIGTGASALQAVPELAPDVAQLSVYQRTPIWVFPKPDFALPAPVRALFRVAPWTQRAVRVLTDGLTELGFVVGLAHYKQLPYLVKGGEAVSRWWLRRQVGGDDELVAKLTPAYGLGCKRPSLSNTYWRTFTRDNVDLVTVGIDRVTRTGIRTRDGREQEFDVLVLATGFHVLENVPPFPVLGLGGREIGEFWKSERFQAYEGTSVKGFPNLWFVLGPYAFSGGSWFSMIEYQVTHALRAITEARRRGATQAVVRPGAHDAWFAQVLRRQQDTVFFNNNCGAANSYYFDEHGDAPFVRPATSYESLWRAKRFPLDDYEYASVPARVTPTTAGERA